MGKKTKMLIEKTDEQVAAEKGSFVLERKIWRFTEEGDSKSSKQIRVKINPPSTLASNKQ